MKSKKLHLFANAYILLSIAYYWIETPSVINPIAIGLLIVFLLHMFVAKGAAKLIFPSIFITLNLFMFLALFSELSEFPSWSYDAVVLLVAGVIYLGINVLSGVVILRTNIQDSIIVVGQ